MTTIIVTGSVCTGKTTLSKELAKKLNFQYIDVNKIITDYNLNEGIDKKYKSKIIDEQKLVKTLIKQIPLFTKTKKEREQNFIIDSHMSHHLSRKYVDLCIITKCDLKKLKSRLKKRYTKNPSKVQINLETEIFDTCLIEAKEMRHKIITTDTTTKLNFPELIKKINNALIPKKTKTK
jgi:broad-specificity NMP kinase